MAGPDQSPDHSVSAVNSNLYCGEEASNVVEQSIADTSISDRPQFQIQSPYSTLLSDEDAINHLLDSEPQFMPSSDYLSRCRDRSVDVTARQDSINWILQVHGYYHFRPVTALLSVNYFDRFFSYQSLPGNGWPFQLLSVACLSLAAKMEEPHVPLLLDLQVLEPGFMFEPKTVQRMELWVMANLDWRLRSVTPFDYLHYFISKLLSCSSSKPGDYNRVFAASSDLILSTPRVIDFLAFPPSTVAAAAVLSATGEDSDAAAAAANGFFFHERVNNVLSATGEDSDAAAANGFFFHERVNNEMVRSCRQLMEEYLIDTCPSSLLKVLTAEPEPAPSPVGVLDAAVCGSCDTRPENPSSSSQAEAAEPLVKRLRSSSPDVQQP